MIHRFKLTALLFLVMAFAAAADAAHPNGVVWEGDEGPGTGKHIVFIAGDHEYRGEETLPALARILAKHDPSKEILPVAWVRQYKPGDSSSRVFATTHGASEDILNEGFRRMLVNAHLWCLGMDEAIKADNDVSFVGPYNPVTFNFGGYRKGVKPADLAGFDTPILGEK